MKIAYYKKSTSPFEACRFFVGAEGLELALQALLRCPKRLPRLSARRFDRGASLASLFPPQAALRRRCPARSACLRHQIFHSYEKQKEPQNATLFAFGRGRRTWTLGTRFWRPLLYQLSYTPIFHLVGHQGLEPRTNRLWAGCSNQLS